MLRAAQHACRSRYKEGARSITQLVSAPRAYQLQKRHFDEITVDVTDLLKPMIGTAMHEHLAKFTVEGEVSERRLYMELEGMMITGQPDLFIPEKMELIDYKTASVFSYLLGEKNDYIAQVNCYRYLIEQSGTYQEDCIESLKLAFIFTDWQWRKGARDDNYPEACANNADVELWSEKKTREYILERISLHKAAEDMSDAELVECTDEEVWRRKETWAVKKNGGVNALRGSVSDSKEQAEAYWTQKGKTGFFVEHRPGETVKCDRFCNAAPFCSQKNNA